MRTRVHAMAAASATSAAVPKEKLLDEASLPALESDVMGDGSTTSDVLRAVLKQYAFSPSLFRLEVARRVLVKAIMLLPEEAFLQCLYLIPEARSDDEMLAHLKSLMELLQTGRFAGVWGQLRMPGLRDEASAVPGFDDAIRGYIATALEVSHTRCPVSVVAASLDLPAAGAASFRGTWTTDGDVVVFPARPETESKPAAAVAPLAYDDVAELARALVH